MKLKDNVTQSHSTFVDGYYDIYNIDTLMNDLEAEDYNLIRVLLNGDALTAAGGNINSSYVANLVDFLKRVKFSIFHTGIFEIVFEKQFIYNRLT